MHRLLLNTTDTYNYGLFPPPNFIEITELFPNSPAQQSSKTCAKMLAPISACLLQWLCSCKITIFKRCCISHVLQNRPAHKSAWLPTGTGFSISFLILDLSTSHRVCLQSRGTPFCLMWAERPGALKGGNSCQLQYSIRHFKGFFVRRTQYIWHQSHNTS